MKIVVLHGQTHKGSTYNITKLFFDKLSSENDEVMEFFMPQNAPPFCIGCFNCFLKGEEQCPHADIVQNIARVIENADLIIMESPCYVMGMSGQLKTYLDHMAYRWMSHRPHPKMFSKVGLVISTAAGAGAKKVTKALKENMFYWGVPIIYSYGKNVGAMNWEMVNSEKKLQIEKEVSKIADDISRKVGRVKPGFKTKAIFKIMQLSQKSNNWNSVDREYWINNRWLKGGRPW